MSASRTTSGSSPSSDQARPVLTSQKQHKQNIARLEIGDEVLTTGGFYAIVNAIESQEDGPPMILLEIADGIEIEGTPIAIQSVNPRGAPLDDDTASDDRSETGAAE